MARGKYESFFRTGFREALGNRAEKLADRLVGKTYMQGRATSRLPGYRKYAAGRFDPAVPSTSKPHLRAVGKNYVEGYRAGMKVGRARIGLGRNVGSFEHRKGQWKKGAGGRFVGSGG
jgi:hypothetical protein